MTSNIVVKKKKKIKTCAAAGIVHVLSTFNNSIITITDMQGNTITWCSAGMNGFKGSRKATAYAAQVAVGKAAQAARDMGMKTVTVIIRGPGSGREAAIRAVSGYFDILAIKYEILMPFNGCRRPKRRRV